MEHTVDPSRPRADRPLLVLAVSTVVGVAYTWPVLRHLQNWGTADWDQHFFYYEVPRVTLLQFGQFPLWNPYYCGGTDLLANPQSFVLSPAMALVLLLGTVPGIKVAIVLCAILGLLGSYRLARDLGLDRFAAWVPALIYNLSGMYAHSLTAGMTWFLTVPLLPWSLLFLRRSFDARRYVLLTALVLTVMFFADGAYVFAIGAPFLLAYAIFASVDRRAWGPLVCALWTFVIALGLGAVKFALAVVFMSDHPRMTHDYSGYSLYGLLLSLVSRDAGTFQLPGGMRPDSGAASAMT